MAIYFNGDNDNEVSQLKVDFKSQFLDSALLKKCLRHIEKQISKVCAKLQYVIDEIIMYKEYLWLFTPIAILKHLFVQCDEFTLECIYSFMIIEKV